MSAFPVPEHIEQRRFSDAIATKALGLPRPLAFMSPSERVRLFQEAVKPMQAVLMRLYQTSLPQMLLIRRGDTFVFERMDLAGEVAELEKQVLKQIELTRAQILGGLE